MRAMAALPETSYRGELAKGKLLFSCSIVSDSLWPHELQQARLPCTSPCPRVCSNSCPLSWWYHPIISSSVAPFFSSCPQCFPVSVSFPMNQLSPLVANVLELQPQHQSFQLGLTGLNSSLSKGFSRFFSSSIIQKHQFFSAQPFLWSSSHSCTWLVEKP